MVGAYSVAQLRISQALTKQGITLPSTDPGIYLTNTLESPHTIPPAPPLFHKPIAQEHERALKIKDSEHVLVCLGNPPYGRHEASSKDNMAFSGGWVRFGDDKHKAAPILEAFLKPARDAKFGIHLKNLYNLYVYFIRWSLWKVFEHKTATGPGILSFITASSYLDGDAFVGVREHMRRICDHIDIIDLGGEGRGTRRDENVFAIKTPVAIFIAWRKSKPNPDIPATVRYICIEGTREEKLVILDSIRSNSELRWRTVISEWKAPFRPIVKGKFFKWPNMTDLFPWQHSGIMAGRTWVIGESKNILNRRWQKLCEAESDEERKILFKESPTGRKIYDKVIALPGQSEAKDIIAELTNRSTFPHVIRFGYRSFDKQYLLSDNRFLDRPGPDLWFQHSNQQLYLNCLINHPLGFGPAITVTQYLPDKHIFRGSYGGNGVFPLYRNATCTEPNVMPRLLGILSEAYGQSVMPEDLVGYVYSILAHPEYTRRFANELASKEIRVPLTKDKKLFANVSEYGKELVWLHTYGERLCDADHPAGQIPKGKAQCTKAVSDQESLYPNEFRYDETDKKLHVGDGEFAPVQFEVWEFEVSGLRVVQSWLGYRMRERSGKKSSPLDDIRPRVWTREFTRELLELLWILETTISDYPKQQQLFEAVLESELFTANELPAVSDDARKAPKIKRSRNMDEQICIELE